MLTLSVLCAKIKVKTINHLFFKCPFATSPLSISIPQDFDGVSWLSTLSTKSTDDGPNALIKALLICWQIWDPRNKCVFEDVSPHPVRVLHVAGQIGMDYWKLNFKSSSSVQHLKNIKW